MNEYAHIECRSIKNLNGKHNNHKKLGIEYLKSIGYNEDDIFDVNPLGGIRIAYCVPDLLTRDGKDWEVKIIPSTMNNTIDITHVQFLFMHEDTTVLVFNKFSKKLQDIVRFGDLIDIKNEKYKVQVSFRLDIEDSYMIRHHMTEKYHNEQFKGIIKDKYIEVKCHICQTSQAVWIDSDEDKGGVFCDSCRRQMLEGNERIRRLSITELDEMVVK